MEKITLVGPTARDTLNLRGRINGSDGMDHAGRNPNRVGSEPAFLTIAPEVTSIEDTGGQLQPVNPRSLARIRIHG